MTLKGVILTILIQITLGVSAQTFDLVDKVDSYSTGIAQTLRIPIKIKNTSDKPQSYVVRIVNSELSGTQKGTFCLDKTCLDAGITEFTKKIEPGMTLDGLHFALETGLVTGQYSIHFEVFTKGNSQQSIQHAVNVVVEEKQTKSHFFQSKDIFINDVYPNPVIDLAFIDYKLFNENVKAKIVVHNILGAAMANIDLSYHESKAKILADELAPGVYFYTVYIDNIGVATRKLIVRR